jgi:hypothetical protein
MLEVIRHNLMFCHQYPTRSCVAGDGGVRSSWDNVASSFRMAAQSREAAATASIKAVGN